MAKEKASRQWATKWDPRIPPKGQIKFKNTLYSDPACKKIFPKGSTIPSNRRLGNIGEILKPTIPKRFPQHGPPQDIGFVKCTRCDLCKHIPENTKSFQSPWDGRKWYIRKHITCLSENFIYLIICTLHENCWYIGSTD